MDLIQDERINRVRRQGRQASATVLGKRRSGYLLGNRFVFADQHELLWMQADPGEFRELKIWRK